VLSWSFTAHISSHQMSYHSENSYFGVFFNQTTTSESEATKRRQYSISFIQCIADVIIITFCFCTKYAIWGSVRTCIQFTSVTTVSSNWSLSKKYLSHFFTDGGFAIDLETAIAHLKVRLAKHWLRL